jgi:hypothetical protein
MTQHGPAQGSVHDEREHGHGGRDRGVAQSDGKE